MSLWTAKIVTCTSDGKIVLSEDRTDILEGMIIEQTLGDERFIKSGDINIQHRDALLGTYLAVYYNGTMVDVFETEARSCDELNLKTDKKSTRLRSIQAKFIEDLGNTRVEYQTDSDFWGYGMANGETNLTIKEINGHIIFILWRKHQLCF